VDDWSDDDKTTQQTHNDSTVEQGNEKDAEESDNDEDGSIYIRLSIKLYKIRFSIL
jgi:hypothetical protein